MERTLTILLLSAVIISGCTTFSDSGMESTPSDSPENRDLAQTTPTKTTTPPDALSSGVPCKDGLQVSLWGLVEPEFWDPDRIRISYTVPSNTSILFVALVDNSIAGVESEQTRNSSTTADGGSIQLREPLSGEHRVEVLIFNDANSNGQLDSGVDNPCQNADNSGPQRINFTQFD